MRWIDRFIKEQVSTAIDKTLEKELPRQIDKTLRKSFATNPNRQLNSTGFKWALVLAFEDAWPDLDRASAISCAEDCLEVPAGTPGYDWSAAAAKDLVQDYVQTYGEAA